MKPPSATVAGSDEREAMPPRVFVFPNRKADTDVGAIHEGMADGVGDDDAQLDDGVGEYDLSLRGAGGGWDEQ